MALAAAAGLASFDQAGQYLDLSNELAAIIRSDNTAFLSRVPMNGVATQVEHSWMEDALNPWTATCAEALDNSETELDVASGHGARFKIGTLFTLNVPGFTEVMQVTAIVADALTIVRGYGSTSPQAGSAGTSDEIQIISHPAQEGQDPPADESRLRTKVSNYTQIFQRGIQISDTLRKINLAGVSDEYAYQVARRLQEIERELNTAIVRGIKSADGGSDTSLRSMGGILEFSSQSGGNVTTTAEALSMDVVNAMAEQVWNDGGTPNFILVSGTGKRTISTFDQAYRRADYSTATAGYVVDRLITDMGFVLDVIVDPSMPRDAAIIGDLGLINVMPLQGDAMHAEDLARTGRSSKGMVSGQYTVEYRNAKEAFAYHNNLS
jgi:hypothetical protein